MCKKPKERKLCWVCSCTDMIPTKDGNWLCPSCDKVDKDKINNE